MKTESKEADLVARWNLLEVKIGFRILNYLYDSRTSKHSFPVHSGVICSYACKRISNEAVLMQKLMEEQADPHLAALFLNTITLRQYGVHADELRNSDYDGDSRAGAGCTSDIFL